MITEIALGIQVFLIFVLGLLYWRLGQIYEALTHKKEKLKKEREDKIETVS